MINRLRPPTDGDIIAPGGTVSIAGTTSVPIHDLGSLHPTSEEVDLIIREASAMLPELKNSTFIRAFSGVRPLTGSQDNDEGRAISRGYVLIDHARDGS